MLAKHYKTLRLILGDQLHAGHSWFQSCDSDVLYVVAELKQEAEYVRHHIQKLCAFFSAMDNFAQALAGAGHDVYALTLDDTAAYQDLPDLIQSLVKRFNCSVFCYQRPDEFRLKQQLSEIRLPEKVRIEEHDTEHFLLPAEEFSDYVTPGKHNRMETFYRKMRKRFDVLLDNGQPLGGQWNFDGDNRQKIPAACIRDIPEPLVFANSVMAIRERIDRHNIAYFGQCENDILWPTTRRQAVELLHYFCAQCLPQFGRYQDAMTGRSEHAWSLYHSRLSFALNTKMLHPKLVLDTVIAAYEASDGEVSIAQIEGFVRQILGWREYVRAVYWVNMPDYAELNALASQAPLPQYFWHGQTRMACMKHSIGQSLEYAYAHHIQRLMITGNFCLLTGIDPSEVDAWYLGVYIDAIEWVEMPNTRGMSQFADGGFVATKPYAASGNYINKMSDYCKDCDYRVQDKNTDNACPFNSLYWGFMVRHRERLAKNPRIGMIYKNWDKQAQEQRDATLQRARWCIDNIEHL